MSAPGPCPGCGALFPPSDGPTHRYIGACAGCWAVFGEVLAREYGDLRYAAVHRLTVDAYAAQHPGVPSPQSISSVAVHLVGLCVTFEPRFAGRRPLDAIRRAAMRKVEFVCLEPPASRGSITVLDVHAARDPVDHAERVTRWARDVWSAWRGHLETVERWARP